MLTLNEFAKGNQRALIFLLALSVVACSRVPSGQQNSTISGVVKNLSEEPVAGALLKVRSAELGLSYMVVSQAQGRYMTPSLPPGRYTVQGSGGGYQSDLAGPVEVSSGQGEKMDVVLNRPQKEYEPAQRMPDEYYDKMMPEGDAKKLVKSRCLLCHSLSTVGGKRGNRQDWEKTVDQMRFYLSQRKDLQMKYGGGPLSNQETRMIVDYLAKAFGEDNPLRTERGVLVYAGVPDPNMHLPRSFLQGADARFVAMEYELRNLTGAKANAFPYDIAVDSEGIVWVSEGPEGMLGRFDLKSLSYTRIAVPGGNFPRSSLTAIAVDPQDQVWVVDVGPSPKSLLYQYNPESKEFKSYEVPAPARLRSSINTLAFVDGTVWATGISSSRIIKVDPRAGTVTAYPIPLGSHPYGMTVGGNSTIWFAARLGNVIGKVDPATGQVTPYPISTPYAEPRRMGVDAEGNIWVALSEIDKLARVDYRTGEFTEYPVPTKHSAPYSVDVDKSRNLIWFSEREVFKIGRFDPSAESFVEFPLPNPDTDVRRIQVDPTNPNRVWRDGRKFGSIGYIEAIE